MTVHLIVDFALRLVCRRFVGWFHKLGYLFVLSALSEALQGHWGQVYPSSWNA